MQTTAVPLPLPQHLPAGGGWHSLGCLLPKRTQQPEGDLFLLQLCKRETPAAWPGSGEAIPPAWNGTGEVAAPPGRSHAGCLMLRGLGCPHKLTLSCTQRSSGSCLMFLEAPAHADPCPELLPGTSDHFAQAKPGPTGMCCFRRALHQQGSSLPRLAQPTSREKAGNNFSGALQSSQERSRKQQSPAWGTSALRDPSVAGQPTFTQHLHAACAQHQAPCALRSGHEVISVPFKRCFPALHQPG